MADVIVKHPDHGYGQILSVGYETGSPLVLVRWEDDSRGNFNVDDLEFIVLENKIQIPTLKH